MASVNDIHEEAMDLAEEALLQKKRGNRKEATRLFERAFQLEKQAAELVALEFKLEPTRSVLLQSAATLALDCEKHREAERLVNLALAGEPPAQIADELRELYEQINFTRHLSTKGIVLSEKEFQMAISGNAISTGIAPSDSFVSRVEHTSKLFYRTAERKLGQKYREQGDPSAQIHDKFGLFLSTPRDGSFAVTFRVGTSVTQLKFEGMDDFDTAIEPEEVVNEVFACLDLYANAEMKALREKIPEESYFRNFVGLANQLLPDGKDVKFVGFTLSNDRQNSFGEKNSATVSLSKPRKEVIAASVLQEETLVNPKKDVISPEITGILLHASKIGSNVIAIVDEDGKKHKITVPEGMMADIVRPLWESKVTVIVSKEKRKYLLEDIFKAE